MTNKEITAMLALKPQYNFAAKQEWKRLSRKFLTATVKQLGLAKGTYDLRFNAGGIAVSGDAILHTDTFYVSMNLDMCDWILARKCHGRKDYGAGLDCPNKDYQFRRLLEGGGVPAFAEWIADQFDEPRVPA